MSEKLNIETMKINDVELKAKNVDGVNIPYLNEDFIWEMKSIMYTAMTSSVEYIKARETAGDVGSCCLGMGIKVPVLSESGTRKNIFIQDAFTQGCISNWKITKPLLDYINEYHSELNAFYSEGVMD